MCSSCAVRPAHATAAHLEILDDQRERRGEEHDLAVGREEGEDLLDDDGELGRQQLVGLVHDEGRAFGQVGDALGREVEDAAGRADEDVHGLGEAQDVVLEDGAAGGDHDVEAEVLAERLADLRRLQRQLARRHHQQRLDLRILRIDLLQRRNHERGRLVTVSATSRALTDLARPVLRSRQDVSARQRNRNRLLLDRRRSLKARLENAHQQLALEVEAARLSVRPGEAPAHSSNSLPLVAVTLVQSETNGQRDDALFSLRPRISDGRVQARTPVVARRCWGCRGRGRSRRSGGRLRRRSCGGRRRRGRARRAGPRHSGAVRSRAGSSVEQLDECGESTRAARGDRRCKQSQAVRTRIGAACGPTRSLARRRRFSPPALEPRREHTDRTAMQGKIASPGYSKSPGPPISSSPSMSPFSRPLASSRSRSVASAADASSFLCAPSSG